jgi:hypothetical protein
MTDSGGQPAGLESNQDKHIYARARETVPRPGKDPGRLVDDDGMPIGELEIGGTDVHSSKLSTNACSP